MSLGGVSVPTDSDGAPTGQQPQTPCHPAGPTCMPVQGVKESPGEAGLSRMEREVGGAPELAGVTQALCCVLCSLRLSWDPQTLGSRCCVLSLSPVDPDTLRAEGSSPVHEGACVFPPDHSGWNFCGFHFKLF